jgi:hypothetical protein
LSKFTSTKVINSRWRNNDFVGGAGSSHTFPDAFHDEFLVEWAQQIADGSIIITETPTTGNIQVATLTVGDIVLTGTATGNFGAGGATIIGTSPISVATASGTSTISLNANYQTAGTYVTSVSGAAPITATGTTAVTVGIDQTALTVAASTNASVLRAYVKNDTGTTLTKGQVVYISGSDGANALISLSTATSEAGSSKTLGILAQTLTTGSHGYVIENGLLVDIDTSAATAGQAIWLGNTPGSFVFGSPPAEPSQAVYLGVVTRVQQNNGEILVKVQNGYELDELHDVSAASPSDGDIIQYKTSSSLWTKASIANAGIAASSHTHAYQPAGTYVTAVNGTAPIAASTDTAGIVSVSLTATYSSSTHDHSGVYQVAGNYASSVHTHGTSDVNSGNFVATLAAGTGVTVTGADGNASAKTVAIGQAVATSDNVTFNQITASDYIKLSSWNQATAGNDSSVDTVTVTTAGTYYAIGGANCEVSFTPDFVGQQFFVTMTGYASLNTTTIQYAFVRVTLTNSSNTLVETLGYGRADNFGTSGRGATVAFNQIWTSDTTSARKIKLYGTVQTTNGLVLSLAYWQLNVMALA